MLDVPGQCRCKEQCLTPVSRLDKPEGNATVVITYKTLPLCGDGLLAGILADCGVCLYDLCLMQRNSQVQ